MKCTRTVAFPFLFFLFFLSSSVFAQSFEELVGQMNSDPMSRVDRGPLPVEQAFVFEYRQSGSELILTFTMPDGYHLYRDKFRFKSTNATFGETAWPEAEIIDDPTFGETPAYSGILELVVPIKSSSDGSSLALAYQGCSQTFCYPPRSAMVYLNAVNPNPSFDAPHLPNGNVNPVQYAGGDDFLATLTGNVTPSNTVTDDAFVMGECHAEVAENIHETQEMNTLEESSDGDVTANKEKESVSLVMFFLIGIGLALTPCVFPMYPILTSVVLGETKKSPSRVFVLSLFYVQGMALVYSAVGVAVALMGLKFQQALQHPYVITAVCVLFVYLAGSLFGWYTIQLPNKFQTLVHKASQKQKSGSSVGAFSMGALSGLVASPCTTAPIAGVLMYIAQSGDVTEGFLALYLMSMGMGVPLVLFAITGNRYLPKAGAWMNIVKNAMGFILIGVSVYFSQRILPSWPSSMLGLLAAFAFSAYLFVASDDTLKGSLRKVVMSVAVLGTLLTTQLASSMIYAKFYEQETQHGEAQSGGVEFIQASSLRDIKRHIERASNEGKGVMLDLYADWCSACHQFEAETFSAPSVVKALSKTYLIQIDLTELSEENDEVQRELGVVGLPTILFFDSEGVELKKHRVFGFKGPQEFVSHIQQVKTLVN
ncbi:MAG: hypothetical protein CBC55_00810 [Gammaproteobacteria bacterium TMED95]|nr:MAG: hypothetical protein CBC55_00810 [Gammaproteobacteria bacterium TMED95]